MTSLPRPRPRHAPAVLACALALALAMAACGSDDDRAGVLIHPITDSMQVFPESVAVVPDGRFFVGSVREGTIYEGHLGDPAMQVWSPAATDGRTIANGMFWSNDRLVVLGRQSGQIYVYDTVTKALLGKLSNGLPSDQTFLNDVVLLPSGEAYVTDSTHPVMYKVSPTSDGRWRLDDFLSFDGSVVQYVQASGAAGINVNGIVLSGDGRYLVVAKRNENALFRIEISTRTVQRVTLPTNAIDNPDGMFLDGQTLYVAQNTLPQNAAGRIAVLRLSADFLTATPVTSVGDSSFAFPTSVARIGTRLLVVNSQFDTLGSPAAVSGTEPPKLPFIVTELDAPR